MPNIGMFLLNNLEIVVASIGTLGVGFFILKKKPRSGKKHNNDLTYLYIKYNKNNEILSKTKKTIF